jgi:hypothetical protein
VSTHLRKRFAVIALALCLTAVLGATGAATATAGSSAGACVSTASSTTSGRSHLARSAAYTSYDDYIEDVQTAPDICASNIVTNDNESLLVALHIHDRAGFAPEDAYSVYLDTDANPATGSLAAPGVPAGADMVLQLHDKSSNLLRWNGSAFELVSASAPIFTVWIPDMGPIVIVGLVDLGQLQNINIAVVTANGTDYDFAPDAGGWSYTVTPLQLTPGALSVGPARAGKQLTAALEVTDSTFDEPLDLGTIACRAKVGGRSLAGRGRFSDDRVACTWRLPKTARGKRLSGSVSVEYQGVVAKRSFAVRVR